MKRTLITALAISFSSFLSASPVYLNSGYESGGVSTSVAAIEINNQSIPTGNDSDNKAYSDVNNQSNKSEKSTDKKVAPLKDNDDGNYRDLQRGRKVLEHKYNLYA